MAEEPSLLALTSAETGEAALVESLRAGKEDAYEGLLRLHGGRMLAVARRLLRNEADAEEALQDAFLAAFRSIGEFRADCRLGTWLHRIVVNAALMKQRSRARRPERSIEEFLPAFLEDGHQRNPSVEWREEAGSELEREELRALVRSSIDRLPEGYRTVLLLRDIEGFDTAETSRLLGVNENPVKIRPHRARQALRGLLDSHLRVRTA